VNLIIIISTLTSIISPLPWTSAQVEVGWHVVGVSIDETYYYTIGDECTIIAYSDYWTEARGGSYVGGWGKFKVRPGDYAIYTTCPLTIYSPANYGVAWVP
jgi:hypothetical protein